jgi:predicted transcriptional regulator
MAATTTIRLPPKLRARVRSLARLTGRSAHSVIIDAIERQVGYEERLRELVRDAREADAELERLRELYSAADVDGWLARHEAGGSAPRPGAWRG